MAAEFVVDKSFTSDRRSAVRFITYHVMRHKWVAAALIMGAFVNAALASTVPYFIGQAFDEIQQPDDGTRQAIIVLCLFIIGAQAARAVMQFIRNYSAELFSQRIERDVRDELYASLLGKSMEFHDFQPVGEIMARVTNDVHEMNFMMNPGFNMLVGSSMFLIAPIIAAPLIYPALIIVPLTFVILHLTVQIFFVRSLHPLAEKVRASFGRMNARLAEALDGLQVIKGTAQESAEVGRFNELTDTVRDYYIDQGRVEARYLSFLLLGLAFVAAFAHAGYLYQQGLIDTGDVVAFIGQIYLFGFPVFSSLFSLSRIASGYASAGRILDIINQETDLGSNPAGYSEDVKGAITFESVDFGYIEGTQVLHDISFSIEPGQTVAIVGQTGAGKTTIAKLINRTYDVDSGRVLVDGVDVRDWSLAALRSQVSVIEQDIFLFSRTIAENIAFGQDEWSQEEIEASAKKAQAHDFILTFPEGYETKIGQRGVTLSGGQRQRLALARAFQSDPPILVLDDSTSAIDSATEDRIQKAIWSAAEGRTTILITHRLSQIRWADHIVVLRKGRIVAQGKHEDLLANSVDYQRIFARYDEPSSTDDATPMNDMDALSGDADQTKTNTE
ncbi:ABC transporter ATP-binding protein [Phototrophicus methaneseepsis]|uniref:ABC transporter ATP-binding protein n=1 Tax=Phototrophicus methaneseepsis TaxID=2710758 RepID=A0A7S8E758_9CHLR|nr:ABC transporter ATP-binding protein [Phototrophicus methaneseepsis]QPC81594.1 ABC transporter ATP-binding protein [Phototrophicus methaneseepsis]